MKLVEEDVDCMILDLDMPGVDGFELCRSLKADPVTADIRIVAITGAPDPATGTR